LFSLFEPLLAREEDLVFTELADPGFDGFVDGEEFLVALVLGLDLAFFFLL
jgi:hypothetical protein